MQQLVARFTGQAPPGDDLGPREEVTFFDYDPETDDGGIWGATLPLTEIYAHGGVDCRITFDLSIARKYGMIVGALLGAIALSILSYMMPGVLGGPNGATMGFMMGGVAGAFGGWMLGHRFAPGGISLFRRVWVPMDPEEIGVWPDHHLEGPAYMVTGELLRETPHGFSLLSIYPLLYTNLKGEKAMDEAVAPKEGNITLVGTEGQEGIEEPFDPSMIRATSMYEVMQQRIDKLIWGRHQSSTWDKVQVGAAVILALVVVSIAAFLLITSSEPQGGASWMNVLMA